MKLHSLSYEHRFECIHIQCPFIDLALYQLADFENVCTAYLESVQNSVFDQLPPYFGRLWPSAIALSQILVGLPRDALQGRRVLEIGCGLALPSFIAASRGAHVECLDLHVGAEELFHVNRGSYSQGNMRFRRENWSDLNSDLLHADLILGSDILYEAKLCAPLAEWLSAQSQMGAQCLVVDPGRPHLTRFKNHLEHFQNAVLCQKVMIEPNDIQIDGFQDLILNEFFLFDIKGIASA